MIFSLLFSSIFSILDFFAQSSTLSLFERDTKKPKVFLLCSTVLSQNDDAQRAHHDHSSSVFCSSRPLEKTIYTKILLLLLLLLSFFVFSFLLFFSFCGFPKKEKLQKRNPKLTLAPFSSTLNFPSRDFFFTFFFFFFFFFVLLFFFFFFFFRVVRYFEKKPPPQKTFDVCACERALLFSGGEHRHGERSIRHTRCVQKPLFSSPILDF